jgi:hypothetical protein
MADEIKTASSASSPDRVGRQVGPVSAVKPPIESQLASRYADASFVDAYAITLSNSVSHDLERMAQGAVNNPPAWVRGALTLRDRVMQMFGVKTYREIGDRITRQGADRVGFMPVLLRSEREIIMGENDRHLDFQVSLLLRSHQTGPAELVATTVVQCHNLLGGVYLAVIMPGHKMVIRTSLRNAAQSV